MLQLDGYLLASYQNTSKSVASTSKRSGQLIITKSNGNEHTQYLVLSFHNYLQYRCNLSVHLFDDTAITYDQPAALSLSATISQYFIGGMMSESANPVQQPQMIIEIRP